MKIVVVGSGGYVGRHLSAHLAHLGVDVHAYSSTVAGGIDAESGALTPGFILPADAEAVVFLAQSPWSGQGATRPQHVLQVNCVAAVTVAQACVAADIPRLIYASTGNVYRASFAPLDERAPLRVDNWYALSKVHAEQALTLFRERLAVHVVRLFGVYGPGQRDRLVPRLIERVARRAPINLEPPAAAGGAIGGLRLSLTYIDDVVGAFARLAQCGGPELLNVAGDEALSVRDIALAVGHQLDIEPVFVQRSETRDGDMVADNRLFHATLAPCLTPFSQGLARTLAGAADTGTQSTLT